MKNLKNSKKINKTKEPLLIVQVHKKEPMVYYGFFFLISGITNEDDGSFTCELMEGNIIKQRQSISILSTDLKIHHSEILKFFYLFRKKKHNFLEKNTLMFEFV